MKRFYAADNYYGSDTDTGFVNTWFVVVFNSRRARDAWVNASDASLARKAITRKQATRNYACPFGRDGWQHGPRPFTGEFWGITPAHGLPHDRDPDDTPGLIGDSAFARLRTTCSSDCIKPNSWRNQ